jgi:hypothetical protein
MPTARQAKSANLDEELPAEGSQAEAEAVIRQLPMAMPAYDLRRVNIATLNVDYAPPHGSGYARPLSHGRLTRLRRDWDPMAVGTMVVSRRSDNTLWIIDGNHRRYIAYERGIPQLPAMVFSNLERAREADLYTKLGTVLGQTPYTRFLSKLVAGDESALEVQRIVEAHDLRIAMQYGDGILQAVARLEWIFARSGSEALDWVLGLLIEAWGGHRDALAESFLEGMFQFWLRYADINRTQLAQLLSGAGIPAINDRVDAIIRRIALNTSHATGRAAEEIWNQRYPKQQIPRWDRAPVRPYHNVGLTERGSVTHPQAAGDPVPQHLGAQ